MAIVRRVSKIASLRRVLGGFPNTIEESSGPRNLSCQSDALPRLHALLYRWPSLAHRRCTAVWPAARPAVRPAAAQRANGRFAYEGDRYGAGVDHVTVQRNFAPEVGFLRRSDFSASTVRGRFSPRLRGSRLVRRLSWSGFFAYVVYSDGRDTAPTESRARRDRRASGASARRLLAEAPGIDPHRCIQLVADRLSRCRLPDCAGEAGDVGEADGEIERDDGGLVRGEREAEGEVAGGGALPFEVERGGARAERVTSPHF